MMKVCCVYSVDPLGLAPRKQSRAISRNNLEDLELFGLGSENAQG